MFVEKPHQLISEGGGNGRVAAGWVGTASSFKTGHRGDHRDTAFRMASPDQRIN